MSIEAINAEKKIKKKRSKKPDEVGGLRARRRNDYLRLVDGIVTSAVFIIVFALFCSARVGYFLLIALLATPGVSILWAFLSSLFLRVEYPDESGMLISKKDFTEYAFYVKNKGLLPSPLIRARVHTTGNLTDEDGEYNLSVFSFGKDTVLFGFCAKMAGEAKAELSDICVEDFFGIVRFPIKNISGKSQITYGIMPEIPEISSKDPILEETMKTAFSEDDPEDTSDVSSYNFSGFPGYDYREYVPGDPLKRINSKLSAKRGNLMVRLDEKPVVAGVVFLLDGAAPDNEEENPVIPGAVENLIETSLGMARTLLSRDFGVTFFWKENRESWRCEVIRSERELEVLARDLGFFSLKKDYGERLPEELAGSGKSIVCFTVKSDPQLTDSLSEGSLGGGDNIRIYNALTGEGRGL